jgi:hypothetical protein
LCGPGVLSGFFNDSTLFFLVLGKNFNKVIWDRFVQLVMY